MPTDRELTEQLADYGEWLLRRAGVAPHSSDPIDVLTELTEQRHRRGRRRWQLVAAAAAAGVIGVAGLVVQQRDGSPESTVSRAPAPPGPDEALFLLPSGGYDATHGQLDTADGAVDRPAFTDEVVLGRPVPGGYVDLITAMTFAERPDVLFAAQADEDGAGEADGADEASGGPSERTVTRSGDEIIEGPVQSTVLARRGDWWLMLTAGSDLGQWLARRAASIDVDRDGDVGLRSGSAYEVVARFPSAVTPTTYLEITTPDDVRVVLETFGWPALAFIRASWAGEATVRGTSGWVIASDTWAEPQAGLLWMETPHHAVALSGEATPEELVAVAEELRIVDEETWRAETGAPPMTTNPES